MITEAVKYGVRPHRRVVENTNHCEIVVVLDRSGSMSTIANEMKGGFDAMVNEQRNGVGTCNLTLVQFDSEEIETVYTAKPIAEVPPLQFIPRGLTPLLDAFGKALADTQARVTDKNTRVFFMVITDGQENVSSEWTREKIKALVEERTKDGWVFQFLGANIDSFAEAGGLGIAANTTMNYGTTSKGVSAVYGITSNKLANFRSARTLGEAVGSMSFTTEEREAAKGE